LLKYKYKYLNLKSPNKNLGLCFIYGLLNASLKSFASAFLYKLSSLNRLLKDTGELPIFYPFFLGSTLIISLDLDASLL
jgi:hypothetical protein